MKTPALLTIQELSTILASLRYWQASGMADNPAQRPDELHAIATNEGSGSECVSMDAASIDELCERLNCGANDGRRAARALVLVEDLAGWALDGDKDSEGADVEPVDERDDLPELVREVVTAARAIVASAPLAEAYDTPTA